MKASLPPPPHAAKAFRVYDFGGVHVIHWENAVLYGIHYSIFRCVRCTDIWEALQNCHVGESLVNNTHTWNGERCTLNFAGSLRVLNTLLAHHFMLRNGTSKKKKKKHCSRSQETSCSIEVPLLFIYLFHRYYKGCPLKWQSVIMYIIHTRERNCFGW